MKRVWVLGLVLTLLAPVLAQPQTGTVPGEPFPPPRVYTLPDFWLNLNSSAHYLEWLDGEHELYFWNYASWLDGDLRLRSPRLVARGHDWNVVAGTQESYGLDALLDWLPFTGGRVDGDALGLRWNAAYGTTTTDNLPALLATPPPARFDMSALGVAFPLHRGVGRLLHSSWTPDNTPAGPDRHQLWSFELDPRLRGPFAVEAAVGYDSGTYSRPATLGDRSAYAWSLGYQEDGVSLWGQQQSNGRGYGPNHEQNYRRGEDFLTLDGSFELSDTLTLSETFQRLGLVTPIDDVYQDVRNQTWVHMLSWQALRELRLAAQWQDIRSRSTGTLANVTSRQSIARLDAFYRPDPAWELIGRMLARDLQGQRSQQIGLQVTHFPADPHRLTLGYDYLTGSAPGFGDQLVLSYQYRPEDALGLNFDFQRLNQSFLDPRLTNLSTTSCSLGLYYEPTARWTVLGNAIYSTGPLTGDQIQYAAEVSYLIDEHNQIGLRYARNPFLTDAFGLNTLVDAGDALTLELRQSFGGPLQAEFHRRLMPRLDVEVLYHPAGAPDHELRPLEGARVRLGEEAPVPVGPDGSVRFRVEEGTYPLSLDLGAVGPNYELREAPPETLTLSEGERARRQFLLTGWSSIYAVVFNDVEGERSLPVGYIPMASVPLELEGPQGPISLVTDEQGVARFARLVPGTYRVSVPPQSLPPSAESTTPTSFEVTLATGQEQVVEVGLRSFGRLVGRLLVQERGETRPVPPGTALLRGSTRLGVTGEDGELDLRVPAGRVELRVDLSRLGSDLYPVDPEALRLELTGGETLERDIVLARYASLGAQLTVDGRPLARSGIPIEIGGGEFLYTDEAGRVDFTRLRAGRYELSLPPESLPDGLALVRPGPVPLELGSGEHREIEIALRRKSP